MVYTIILLSCDRFAWFWIILDGDDIDQISCRFLFSFVVIRIGSMIYCNYYLDRRPS
jgi:hypothetical protein